ncbi:nuclease-related domain-containing protein [Evansella cellulosilytica]|uniref:NERD domain protein n=1 Tax=Evansella cellulosilytica (strain ATCC 21833 / DSM 2522 / FERM P-1141 / JCM 9156 / N-4) TaxID=649639 RepID=E6TVR5_EVAC2|nr:nuclease-related domain-containing protein [Evansella cellulosilytica]ADU32193.1 NERD domain protein [Evansella cellulosilytica DSM 2522]
MIRKSLKKSLHLRRLEAAVRRVHASFPNKHLIEFDLSKFESGYKGEKSLEYYFSFLDETAYDILFNVRLPCKGYYFQIDAAIITSNFVILLDSKHISGDISFEHNHHQLVRKFKDEYTTYSDPIEQGERHSFQFQKWLKDHGFPPVPVFSKVVVTNLNSRIIVPPQDYKYKRKIENSVIKSTQIVERVNGYNKSLRREYLSEIDRSRLINTLIQHHTPSDTNILQIFKIPKELILTGVHCPSCHHIPMIKFRNYWLCTKCGCKSADAFKESVLDYALLCGPQITNKQLRKYLNISRSRSFTILRSMNLTSIGTTRDRVYIIPLED